MRCLQNKLDKMGVQQSCLDRVGTKELEDIPHTLNLVTTSQYQGLVKCEPYQLTPEANHTYRRFVQQFNNNQYLDLHIEKEGFSNVKQLQGFFKLSIYDACYHGQWKNSKPYGRGIAIFPNGSILVGIFYKGYCEGESNYFIYSDGTHYVGSIHSNKISGKGKLTNQNITYDGNWSENLPHGEGIQYYTNGDRYIGTFERGLKHGHDSLFIWNSHELYLQYKGAFKEGKINGEGTLILRNKTTVQGIFDQSAISNCTFSSNKYKFTGNYQNGKFNGKGVLELLQTHQSFDGSFKQGKLFGQCKIKDAKHRDMQAYFYNNRQFKKVNGLREDQLEKIIKIVENAYSSVQRHSDALIQINQDLQQDYECKFIEPFENLFKHSNYLIINILDKVLLIKAKQISIS